MLVNVTKKQASDKIAMPLKSSQMLKGLIKKLAMKEDMKPIARELPAITRNRNASTYLLGLLNIYVPKNLFASSLEPYL